MYDMLNTKGLDTSSFRKIFLGNSGIVITIGIELEWWNGDW